MSGEGPDRPREGPPEKVRSSPEPSGAGPVPVRDLLKAIAPDPASTAEAGEAPAWGGAERVFRHEEVEWVARAAGAGLYGTGRIGTARLVAVHFYRADDPATPRREALVAAGLFPQLDPRELRELFERATPIELER